MKLQHRITGTILAIAFATTTVLPAATIPNLKSPPKVAAKVVSVPRVPVAPRPVNIPKVITPPKIQAVKVPVAPRIPAATKVVSAPKVPTVKIPSLKVPVPPKVVAIKVPAVKLASMPKAPATSRGVGATTTPSQSRLPTKVLASSKIVKSIPAATARETKKPVTNPKLNPKGGAPIVKEVLQAPLIERMPDLAGLPALPARDLPGTRKPSLAPSGERKPSLDGGSGTSTPTASPRPITTLGDGQTNKPAFDNGFGSRPQLSEADLGDTLNLNPMKGDQGGPASSGPLGTSAADGDRSNGPADQGDSLVSDGNSDAGSQPAEANPYGVKEEGVSQKGERVVVYNNGTVSTHHQDGSHTTYDPATGVTTTVHKNRDGTVSMKDSNGSFSILSENGTSTVRADGTSVVHNDQNFDSQSADAKSRVVYTRDGGRDVFNGKIKIGTIDKDGNITVHTPDPENPDGGRAVLSAVITQQLKQGKGGNKGSQGGGADVMPGNESLTGGTARIPGAAVPKNTNGLVGQPKDASENGRGAPPPNTNSDANVSTPPPTGN